MQKECSLCHKPFEAKNDREKFCHRPLELTCKTCGNKSLQDLLCSPSAITSEVLL